jgi:hypothetical protein
MAKEGRAAVISKAAYDSVVAEREKLTVNSEPLQVVKSWRCPKCHRTIGGLRVHADGCPLVGAATPGEEG